MFKCSVLLLAVLGCSHLVLSARGEQYILSDNVSSFSNSVEAPQIAIIGAGMSGASTAYWLNQFQQHHMHHPKVVVYEASNTIGGRVITALNPDKEHQVDQVLELGAYSFSDNDKCVDAALRGVDLDSHPVYDYAHIPTGLWNGKELQVAPRCDLLQLSWLEQAKLVWRYGTSVWHLSRLLQRTMEIWNDPLLWQGQTNITHALTQNGISGAILATAEDYFKELNLPVEFVQDYAEACTRADFQLDLGHSRGLTSMLSMRSTNISSVRHGNVELIRRMVMNSSAELRIGTRITAMSPGISRRYKLATENSGTVSFDEYDLVVIATPLHSSNINLDALKLESHQELFADTDYDDVFVTFVATQGVLDPAYFNLSGTAMPLNLFTTTSRPINPDILSITWSYYSYIDRQGCLPGDECDQVEDVNLYRITSRTPMTNEMVVNMIDVSSLDDMYLSPEVADGTMSKASTLSMAPAAGIRWIYRQSWPKSIRRYDNATTSLDDLQLAPHLYYLSLAENYVSSLDMSCHMGRNIAQRILHHNRLSGPYE